MSIDHLQTTAGARPLPNGEPASWVYLADLSLPPEEQSEVERRCRQFWWWERRRLRQGIEEDVKLRHFFPGLDVAFRRTPRGKLILMAGDCYSPEFRAFLNRFPRPRPEGHEIVVWPVRDPNDTTSIIG
jgi:hypothetical protein